MRDYRVRVVLSGVAVVDGSVLCNVALYFFVLCFDVANLVVRQLAFVVVVAFKRVYVAAVRFVNRSFGEEGRLSRVGLNVAICVSVPLAALKVDDDPRRQVNGRDFAMRQVGTVTTIFFVRFYVEERDLDRRGIGASAIAIVECCVKVDSRLRVVDRVRVGVHAGEMAFMIRPFRRAFLARVINEGMVLRVVHPATSACIVILSSADLQCDVGPVVLCAVNLVFHFMYVLRVVVVRNFSKIL